MEDKEYKYMVGVRCFTFNHSKYILDALNGFVMQRTNFPYVVMVIDDASTDGEQEVIRKFVDEQFDTNDTSVAYEKETDYAIVTYAQHKTNKNCYIAVLYLKENHYSQRKPKMPYLAEWRDYVKYEALCEGDDYWIHPQKLQMQVDFMENNPDCSLCFHNAIKYYVDAPERYGFFNDIRETRDVRLEELIWSWIVPTASMLFRIDVVRNYPSWTRQIYSGDFTLQLIAYSKGKVFNLSHCMSLYRMSYNGNSSTSINSKKGDYVLNQHLLLLELYNQYTNFRYNKILYHRILYLKKNIRFMHYRKKSIMCSILCMPIFSFKKLISKIVK